MMISALSSFIQREFMASDSELNHIVEWRTFSTVKETRYWVLDMRNNYPMT